MKFILHFFKKVFCVIIVAQGFSMYSQVHVENAENVVVHNENNVHFFGKTTIKSDAGAIIEVSEVVKTKLSKKSNNNLEFAESIKSTDIDTNESKLNFKTIRIKSNLTVSKEEKVKISAHKLKIVTKFTQKQSKISCHNIVSTSLHDIYETENRSIYSLGKYTIINTENSEIVPENQQNQILNIDFIEQNKPFLNLHNVSQDEIQLNPSKNKLKESNLIIALYSKRGPPFYSLN